MKKNIIYKNKDEFLRKLKNIQKDWRESLHILADFDNTITKSYINWKRSYSLISVAREEKNIIWGNFSEKCCETFNKYYSIEIDPKIKIEEKVKYMEKWWEIISKLLIENNFSKKHCEEIARSKKIELRDKEVEFFKNNKDIPFIIISASWVWSYPIKCFLENKEVYYDNIEIISNDFIWDEKGVAIKNKGPLIHSFKKSKIVLKEYKEIYKKIEKRKNVILLWDSLWDPDMVSWFEYENLISIGFLNQNEDDLLEEYKKVYDIIITWDWSFSIINEILESIK